MLVATLKAFPLTLRFLRSIEESIVTAGGISVKEVNPKTMQSKLVPNLYFAGEVLDLDAFTGGYNIQIALSTGAKAGKNAAMYRVSSRSFPNRMAVENDGKIAVVPRPGAEGDLAKNPYISYNCLRIAGEWAIATNGSQTDPITEKIAAGMPVRDAITLGLLALDYEHESLDTPRIVAVVHRMEPVGYLGIIPIALLLVNACRFYRARKKAEKE